MFSTLHTHTQAWTTERDPTAGQSPVGDFDCTPVPSNRPSLSMMRRSDGDSSLTAKHQADNLMPSDQTAGINETEPPPVITDHCSFPCKVDLAKAAAAPHVPANDLTDMLIPPRRSSVRVQKEDTLDRSKLLVPAAATHTQADTSDSHEMPALAKSPWQDGPFSSISPPSETDLHVPTSKVRPASPHVSASAIGAFSAHGATAPVPTREYGPPLGHLSKVAAIEPTDPDEPGVLNDGDESCRIESFSTVGSHEGHHHYTATKSIHLEPLRSDTQLFPEPGPEHSLAECTEYPVSYEESPTAGSRSTHLNKNTKEGSANSTLYPLGQRSLSLGSLLYYNRTSQ